MDVFPPTVHSYSSSRTFDNRASCPLNRMTTRKHAVGERLYSLKGAVLRHSGPQLPVERTILDGFGDVLGCEPVGPRQIGDRAKPGKVMGTPAYMALDFTGRSIRPAVTFSSPAPLPARA